MKLNTHDIEDLSRQPLAAVADCLRTRATTLLEKWTALGFEAQNLFPLNQLRDEMQGLLNVVVVLDSQGETDSDFSPPPGPAVDFTEREFDPGDGGPPVRIVLGRRLSASS